LRSDSILKAKAVKGTMQPWNKETAVGYLQNDQDIYIYQEEKEWLKREKEFEERKGL
jgi:hypothetical protein